MDSDQPSHDKYSRPKSSFAPGHLLSTDFLYLRGWLDLSEQQAVILSEAQRKEYHFLSCLVDMHSYESGADDILRWSLESTGWGGGGLLHHTLE
jgi:hypothetical protein